MNGNNTFTAPHPLKTAVLFLIYKRLDTTMQVFEAIKKAKPPILYIAQDGPKEGEEEKVRLVRKYVLDNIDWNCKVKTLFRDRNLGCGKAVSEAITWFFENEEMGIILEDDTLPSQSFFWFCEELLEKYKDELRIGMISGCNFQRGIKRGSADYYFSIYNHIWGWASWFNRWKNYDFELKDINDPSFIDELFHNASAIKYWKKIFEKVKKGKIDTWDYQWTFTLWKNKQLTIIPNINLVKNIGFGKEATHTNNPNDANRFSVKAYELVLKNHPLKIERDFEADDFTFKTVFAPKPFLIRVVNKLKRILNKLRGLIK